MTPADVAARGRGAERTQGGIYLWDNPGACRTDPGVERGRRSPSLPSSPALTGSYWDEDTPPMPLPQPHSQSPPPVTFGHFRSLFVPQSPSPVTFGHFLCPNPEGRPCRLLADVTPERGCDISLPRGNDPAGQITPAGTTERSQEEPHSPGSRSLLLEKGNPPRGSLRLLLINCG